jgi:hypothetical protein
MSKIKRYRVAHLFTHEGRTYTNDDEAKIRELPTAVRAHHVERGNLEEYEADEKPPVPLAAANATPKTKE